MACRLVLIVVLLFASVACASDGQPDAVDGPIQGPWRPVPIALAGPIVGAVDRACRASMEDFPQQTRLVVIDARGAGRIQAQYAGPRSTEATCIDLAIDGTGNVVATGVYRGTVL